LPLRVGASIPLLAVECDNRSGKRYILVAQGQRITLSGAWVSKLERDGRIRAAGRLNGRTLFILGNMTAR